MRTETEQEGKMSTQEMMEVYKKLGTPGAQHKNIARMEGTWDAKVRAWMDPEEPPHEFAGISENKMVLDGRFLKQKFSGQMMGDTYDGISYIGYDNHTGKYVTTWMDSMSTSIMLFEGTASEDGNTIMQTSQYDDPIQGPMKYHAVTKFIDDNTIEFEMNSIDKTGKEEKMMEITYTKK